MRARLAWCALGLALCAGGAFAETPAAAAGRQAQSIARATMSPFCPGKTIAACPSPRAEQWRADIRAWVSQGASAGEIQARLQRRAPGFDLEGRPGRGWDWALPLGALAVVTIWLLVLLARLRPRGDGEQAAPPLAAGADDAELDTRLEAELLEVG
jgi:cytochrome c-type biogenesis protein CcmH/NrfF